MQKGQVNENKGLLDSFNDVNGIDQSLTQVMKPAAKAGRDKRTRNFDDDFDP